MLDQFFGNRGTPAKKSRKEPEEKKEKEKLAREKAKPSREKEKPTRGRNKNLNSEFIFYFGFVSKIVVITTLNSGETTALHFSFIQIASKFVKACLNSSDFLCCFYLKSVEDKQNIQHLEPLPESSELTATIFKSLRKWTKSKK